MSGWRCDGCEDNPEWLRRRGHCGGPFPDVGDGFTRDDGRVYVGADLCVGTEGGLMDPGHPDEFERHYSCPVAAARGPMLGHVVAAWKSWKAGGLRDIEPHPSAALVDAVLALDGQVDALTAYEMRPKDGK